MIINYGLNECKWPLNIINAALVVIVSPNTIVTIQSDHCFVFWVEHFVYLVASYHMSPEVVNMNNRLDDISTFDAIAG